jgi:hypothetical protein
MSVFTCSFSALSSNGLRPEPGRLPPVLPLIFFSVFSVVASGILLVAGFSSAYNSGPEGQYCESSHELSFSTLARPNLDVSLDQNQASYTTSQSEHQFAWCHDSFGNVCLKDVITSRAKESADHLATLTSELKLSQNTDRILSREAYLSSDLMQNRLEIPGRLTNGDPLSDYFVLYRRNHIDASSY